MFLCGLTNGLAHATRRYVSHLVSRIRSGVKYRTLIVDAVTHVVRARLDKARAISYVRGFAESQVPLKDQAIFIEVVETQLMNLHEGNMARYRLRPSEFEAWLAEWR